MTPETLKTVVQARLVQTFRQYPRAGLHLSASCRNALIEALTRDCIAPDELKARMEKAITTDKWTLQARLAWGDIAESYESAYQANSPEHNTALLQAVSDGILAAGKIPVGDNVPIRTTPPS